jgi:hypothetical protein
MAIPEDEARSNLLKDGNKGKKMDLDDDYFTDQNEVKLYVPTPEEARISWDFEDGTVNGWNFHLLGDAFYDQPVSAYSITIPAVQRRPDLVPLGGNYWQNSPYPLITGNQGEYLLASNPNSGGGMIFSNDFRINQKYIDFLIGGLGIGGTSGSFIELLVLETEEEALNRALLETPGLVDLKTGKHVQVVQEFTQRLKTDINNTNGVMHPTSWYVGEYLDRTARIRISAYSRGRVLVDNFRFR